MKKLKIKKAFSMIELIIVMVVLGIVASMGATIIAQVYENYVMQRSMHDATSKTQLAASIIFNRLSNRIARTTIGRDLDNIANYKFINDVLDTDEFEVLEWYGVASDSFVAVQNGTNQPAWSGVSDIYSNATNGGNIVTPGSNLEFLNTIIPNVSSSTVDDMAIIFSNRRFSATLPYNVACMGYTNSNCIAGIQSVNGNNIVLDQNYTMRVHEQYKLTRSAYALVPTNIRMRQDNGVDKGEIFDLELRYDYQPWEGESFDDNSTSRVTLLENVSVFRFTGIGDTIRFKICVDEQIGGDAYVSLCKEKAVIR